MQQASIFDFLYEKYKITKPIRLIELFAGYGSQALALKYLGVDFTHWHICEWATKSIQAYNDIHIRDYTDYSKDLTQEEIIEKLAAYGISMNYNEPMTYEQIKRKGEKWQRETYNNIIATHNLVNIQNAKAKDFNIVDTDKYEYIWTYSFPCQDLSNAGKGLGMSRDSGTRSGMLWEVERLLEECVELSKIDKRYGLPSCLIMENVPQVIGTNSIKDFIEWQNKLESLGYSNYVKVLNAKDYYVPQNRERCFMISILGSYNYNMPRPMLLKYKLKDILEKNVKEKYYLSSKMIKCMTDPEAFGGFRKQQFERNFNKKEDIAFTITCNAGQRPTDNFILVKEATKKGYVEAYEGDSINLEQPNSKTRRGRVGKEVANTLLTSCQQGVVIKEEYQGMYQYAKSDNFMKGKDRFTKNKELADTLTTSPKEGVVLKKDTPNYIEWEEKGKLDIDCRAWKEEAVAPTTTTTPKTKVLLNNLRIRKLTPKECFRLMGVSDNDFRNAEKNQSQSSLYHLAGDSIVTTCLMGLFGELLGIDYTTKIKELVEELKEHHNVKIAS